MDQPNYTDQQIDDFIMGLLDEKEKALFNKELASNNELAIRLEDRRVLIKGIEEYHSLELKHKLKNIHSKVFDSAPMQTARRRSLIPWIAAAATIALLIVALLWMNNSKATSEQLYASNFKPFELSFTQRDDVDTQLLQLEVLYDNGQYEEAIPIFESKIRESNNPGQLQLGIGISKMAVGQNEAALQHFDIILKSGDLLFKDHAIWYSALTYLKMDDREQAKRFLQQLVEDREADHHGEAVKLLEEMD